MTPTEILKNLRPGSSDNHAAWTALDTLLRSMAEFPIRARDGNTYLIPEDARGDIAQDVALSLLRLASVSELAIAEQGDPACRRYLQVSLVNRHIELARRRKRLRSADLDKISLGPDSESMIVAPQRADTIIERIEEEEQSDALRSLVTRIYHHLRETRSERYRADLEMAWVQFVALFFDGVPMPSVLARYEGVNAETSPRERERASERIYTRHTRLRVGLKGAANQLHASGALSARERALALRTIDLLVRKASGPEEPLRPG